MIKVILLTFESVFFLSKLYITKDFSYFEESIDGYTYGILIDFNSCRKYQVSDGNKSEIPFENTAIDVKKRDPLFSIEEAFGNDTISYLGYKCIEQFGTMSRLNYKAKTYGLVADIPEIENYLPNLEYRKALPIVNYYYEMPYLYLIYYSSFGPKQDGTPADEMVYQKLTSVKESTLEIDFFEKLLCLPTVDKL